MAIRTPVGEPCDKVAMALAIIDTMEDGEYTDMLSRVDRCDGCGCKEKRDERGYLNYCRCRDDS